MASIQIPELVVFAGEVPESVKFQAAAPQMWADLLAETAAREALDEAARADLADKIARRAVSLAVSFRPEMEGNGLLEICYPVLGSLTINGDAVSLASELPGKEREELEFRRLEGTDAYQLTAMASAGRFWRFNRPLRPEAAQADRDIIDTLNNVAGRTLVVAGSLTNEGYNRRFAEVTVEPAA
jgi:hypothetical protein